MNKQYILSIDIGTSSCKVVLFDMDGTIIKKTSKEHSTYYCKNGGVEQQPNHWWENTVWAINELFKQLNLSKSDIAVIGVDSQSSAMIAMTKDGKILHPAMIWTDRRATYEKKWIDMNVGQGKINEINGNHNDESNVALKLMWLRNNYPELYKQTDQVLNATGYMVYKLTGCFSMNISEGGLTQMFDIHNGKWSKELIKDYGLHNEKMPSIYPCHEVVGGVNKKTAELLGIREGTKVVAGSMDAVACALGCGVIEKGDSFITGGTVTALGICSNKPISNDSVHVYHHIVPGTWCNVAGVDFGGGSYRWFRDNLMNEYNGENIYQYMNSLAEDVKIGSDKLLFLPTLVGQRCPQWDGNMKGLYFGIIPSHTKGHFIRALMEGNALSIKEILEILYREGVVAKEITIAGGIAQSDLWMSIFADVLGIPLFKAKNEEATAVGNMINAAYGAGIITSFKEAKELIKVKEIPFNIDNNKKYNKLYEVYKNLYPELKQQFKKLEDLSI